MHGNLLLVAGRRRRCRCFIDIVDMFGDFHFGLRDIEELTTYGIDGINIGEHAPYFGAVLQAMLIRLIRMIDTLKSVACITRLSL